MQRDIKETKIHPYSTVTDWPSVKAMAMVVLRPLVQLVSCFVQGALLTNGTAMMANESPKILIILKDLGSSDL